jgi:xylan 1,4-beta-xylosidase
LGVQNYSSFSSGEIFADASADSQAKFPRDAKADQELDFHFRLPNQPWQRREESAEISGMHHNVLGGFLDVRPALCAWGSGSAAFRNFQYWPRVELPTES